MNEPQTIVFCTSTSLKSNAIKGPVHKSRSLIIIGLINNSMLTVYRIYLYEPFITFFLKKGKNNARFE